MAHLNTALVEHFLNIWVTQRKAVVQPNCMLNDRHLETVAIGLGIGHGQSAYPDPVKATQPEELLLWCVRKLRRIARLPGPGTAAEVAGAVDKALGRPLIGIGLCCIPY